MSDLPAEVTAEQVEPAPLKEPAPAAREWTDTDAEEARALGWKAPEEWAGEKPAGYIDDPRRYLERAENFSPFKKIKEARAADRAEYDDRLRKLEAMSTKAFEVQKAQFEARLSELKDQRRAAAEVGDVAQYDKIDRQLDGLKAPEPEPVKAEPAQPKPDPVIAAYVAANEWAKDPALWEFAKGVVEQNKHIWALPAEKQLAFAEKHVREMFPERFTSPAPTKPRVDGGGLGGGARDAFGQLPAEARAQFNRDVKNGLFTDDAKGRASWAEDYNNA